jgi:uncharacterized FlaG/YvyC family protein
MVNMNSEGIQIRPQYPTPANEGVSATPYSHQRVRLPEKQVIGVEGPKGPLLHPDQSEELQNDQMLEPGQVQEISEALNQVVDVLEDPNRIRFSISDGDRLLLQIVNQETGEVIKSYPSEEVHGIMNKVREAVGLIVDELR